MATGSASTDKKTAIPSTVWILGFVSLLMDISSEMVQTLLPLYLVAGLGASAMMVGFIEGLSVAIATITKLFSGVISDWTGRRKPLAVAGYGLAALSKLIFPLATTAGGIVTAKAIDRVGKGIRGTPRDALIADVTPPEIRGAAFGLRKSLDTVGGFVGPLVAIGLMLATRRQHRHDLLDCRHPGLHRGRTSDRRHSRTGIAARAFKRLSPLCRYRETQCRRVDRHRCRVDPDACPF